MRLFVAIDIDPEIRGRIARFVEGMRGFAPEARWVSLPSLHLTLKFIGERPPEDTEAIKRALASIPAPPAAMSFQGCGFFPTPRAARVFWIGIEAGPELPALAAQVESSLLRLKIPREDRAFSPHLTLARAGDSRHPRGGSGRPGFEKGDQPNSRFSRLQQKLTLVPPPEFGRMTANEFFLYESKLLPGGAQYTKLARFRLGVSGDAPAAASDG
jgi:2'-5' RNA ligase